MNICKINNLKASPFEGTPADSCTFFSKYNSERDLRYLALPILQLFCNPFKYIFILLLFQATASSAQTIMIDSLRKVLKSEQDGKTKVNILNKLSDRLETIGNYDSSLLCANLANELASELSYNRGQADALRNIGIICDDEGNYPQALAAHLQAFKINSDLNDLEGMAHNYLNIGNTYLLEENYSKALEYELMALARFEETHDDRGRASVLSNIGSIYYNNENPTKALEYMLKALPILQKLGDNNGTAATLGNIGLAYSQKGNDKEALDYTLKALAINQKVENQNAIAENYSNIGLIYDAENDEPNAMNYNGKALMLYRILGDKNGIANSYGNIGNVERKQKHFAISKLYLDSSLNLSKEIKDNQLIQFSYSALTTLDSAKGDFKMALEDYKNSFIYRDSITNESNTKKIVQAEMNFEFQHKQDSVKAAQEKKDVMAEQEKNKQIIIRDFFVIGFVLTLTLAFFIFRGYRQKQKDNITITKQKEEVELQKLLVDEKNKNILDSITYAKRIQNALLKDEERVSMHLPDHFILFKPKDIVSGDFYWALEKDDYIYFAAVDCTGHGVPGAFMSMLGVSFLNEITSGNQVPAPAQILDKLRERVLKELGQGEDRENKDGMDISLLRINLKTRVLEWSGANNPMYMTYENTTGMATMKLVEIEPDKQPIGYFPVMKPFRNHKINAEKDSICYLFTDGFADQFGGLKGKKFKYSQFKDLLLSISKKPLPDQKKLLNDTFELWKGNLEQVDDVLIIGIKV